ncbi:SPOR domain-containing protein [Altererythrobacter luteolus]|uniref:SPOR domain-containing protein n=2 Tax=Pontixanthobacter luteolus TaxID=295089 RepID=A0A6I4V1U8_9SPHN|nr:SPOR domain-containing protein [Pontixanthobacter luteolus]
MVHEGNDRDGEEPFEGEDYEAETSEDLGLVEEDEPLPWLESDYDEEEEGYDTGRLVGFALLGLLAVALLVALIWWFSNRSTDPDLVEQGGTIEAPEGPIKEKPDDAGGKTFEGTGNVAPGVGEGKTTEGRIAAEETPRPSIDAAASSSEATAAASGVAVQVGAFSTRESALAGWNTLRGQTEALQGVKYRIEEGKADIGTVFRLQAMAGDAASARALCSALKSDGVACQVKR